MLDTHLLEQLQDWRAAVPSSVRSTRHNILASERTHGHRDRTCNPNLDAIVEELALDFAKASFAPLNKIHLVHRRNNMTNAKQTCDERVSTRLCRHSTARINQCDRQLTVARTSRHIACVLLVPWTIGNDETAMGCCEISVRNINCDSLLALCFKPINDKR